MFRGGGKWLFECVVLSPSYNINIIELCQFKVSPEYFWVCIHKPSTHSLCYKSNVLPDNLQCFKAVLFHQIFSDSLKWHHQSRHRNKYPFEARCGVKLTNILDYRYITLYNICSIHTNQHWRKLCSHNSRCWLLLNHFRRPVTDTIQNFNSIFCNLI